MLAAGSVPAGRMKSGHREEARSGDRERAQGIPRGTNSRPVTLAEDLPFAAANAAARMHRGVREELETLARDHHARAGTLKCRTRAREALSGEEPDRLVRRAVLLAQSVEGTTLSVQSAEGATLSVQSVQRVHSRRESVWPSS